MGAMFRTDVAGTTLSHEFHIAPLAYHHFAITSSGQLDMRGDFAAAWADDRPGYSQLRIRRRVCYGIGRAFA